ncbi:hypothetical protein FRAHR75_40163 [Frankia sp. Hr75.2]|nr:hypothetical protein FRAHR75_40163 [Frankia sp. Hr75.2]
MPARWTVPKTGAPRHATRILASSTLSHGRGVWRSLVARFVRDEEVVGSNPATPTQVRGMIRHNRVTPLTHVQQ